LKKLQGNVKDAQDRLSEEQSAHNATKDLLSASEKRFGKILKQINLSITISLFQVLFIRKLKNYVLYSIV
jgi:hypothetical protein